MEARVVVEFPTQRLVQLNLFVPAVEQRPETVCNLLYLLSGKVPPPPLCRAVFSGVPAFHGVDESGNPVAGGVAPLVGSAFVRVEKGVVAEFGTSTSKSVFGGFTKSEGVTASHALAAAGTASSTNATAGVSAHSLAARMEQRQHGTILVSNLGPTHTNASRYILILRHGGGKQVEEEFANYTPVGIVTAGMEEFVDEVKSLSVNPRTLQPQKPVRIVTTEGFLDYRQRLVGARAGAAGSPVGGNGSPLPQRTVLDAERDKRRTGKRRGREEEDPDANKDGAGLGISDGVSATALREAVLYFQVNPLGANIRDSLAAKVPREEKQCSEGLGTVTPNLAASSGRWGASGLASKRRRSEAVVVGEDGSQRLQTTAIHLANSSALSVRPVGGELPVAEGSSQGFDYFAAQELAFHNDLAVITEVQNQRSSRRRRREAKTLLFSKKAGSKSAALSAASGVWPVKAGAAATTTASTGTSGCKPQRPSLADTLTSSLLGTSTTATSRRGERRSASSRDSRSLLHRY